MSEESHNQQDVSPSPRLKPEDQAKVDEFVSRGVNSVERKPFRPLRLVIGLLVVVTVFSQPVVAGTYGRPRS